MTSSVSLCLPVSLPLSPSLFLSLFSLSLFLSLSLSIYLSIYLSISFSLSHSLSFSLSLSPLSLSLPPLYIKNVAGYTLLIFICNCSIFIIISRTVHLYSSTTVHTHLENFNKRGSFLTLFGSLFGLFIVTLTHGDPSALV